MDLTKSIKQLLSIKDEIDFEIQENQNYMNFLIKEIQKGKDEIDNSFIRFVNKNNSLKEFSSDLEALTNKFIIKLNLSNSNLTIQEIAYRTGIEISRIESMIT